MNKSNNTMTDNQKYIYQPICEQIKMGFESLSETKERMMECVEG